MGDEKGNGMLGCIWFVSATQERKGEKALKTEIRKICICILTIYMYCSVSNVPTISHREGKYTKRLMFNLLPLLSATTRRY